MCASIYILYIKVYPIGLIGLWVGLWYNIVPLDPKSVLRSALVKCNYEKFNLTTSEKQVKASSLWKTYDIDACNVHFGDEWIAACVYRFNMDSVCVNTDIFVYRN